MQGGTQHLDTKLTLSQSQNFDFEYKDTKTHSTFVGNRRNTQRNQFEQSLAWKIIQNRSAWKIEHTSDEETNDIRLDYLHL